MSQFFKVSGTQLIVIVRMLQFLVNCDFLIGFVFHLQSGLGVILMLINPPGGVFSQGI